jgi:hypothetical protein
MTPWNRTLAEAGMAGMAAPECTTAASRLWFMGIENRSRRRQTRLPRPGRRLVKDYERYASTLAGLHIVAFTCFMLRQAASLAAGA